MSEQTGDRLFCGTGSGAVHPRNRARRRRARRAGRPGVARV